MSQCSLNVAVKVDVVCVCKLRRGHMIEHQRHHILSPLQVVQFVDGRKWDLYTQFEVK